MDVINRSNNHHEGVGDDEDYHAQENCDQHIHGDIEAAIHQLRKDVEEIHSRNKERDKDKAFETSYTRMFSVMLFTYCVLLAYFRAMNIEHPELNAIVPALGFYMSTWSMSFVKWMWVKYWHHNTNKL